MTHSWMSCLEPSQPGVGDTGELERGTTEPQLVMEGGGDTGESGAVSER